MGVRHFLSEPKNGFSAPVLPIEPELSHEVINDTHESGVDASKITKQNINGNDLLNTWIERPDWQLSGKYLDHIASLKSRFSKGDNVAGFILAANSYICDRASGSQSELESKIDRASDLVDSQRSIDRMISKFEFCEGVTQHEREQHVAYFSSLADSGFTPALEVLGSIPDNIYMQLTQQHNLPRDDYVNVRDQFKKTKYRYLNQAASQGSMFALFKLSYLNIHRPKLIEAERQSGHSSVSLALANSIALLYFTENNVTHNRATYQQDKLYKIASPEELREAEQLASEIIFGIRESGRVFSAVENDRPVHTFY